MSDPLSYAGAVYTEDCDALTVALLDTVRSHFAYFPEGRTKAALIAAALATVANEIDQADFLRHGVTGHLISVCANWAR